MPWSIIFVGACALGFGLLARVFPCNPGQKAFSRETGDDVLYYLLNVLFYTGLSWLLITRAVESMLPGHAAAVLASLRAGWGWLPTLPIVVQILIMLLVTDVIQYWLHRGFHSARLWPFHAIHHGARNVDWATTFRVHPVNYLAYSTSVAILTQLMGFSPMVFVILGPINFVHAALVHANLNWTFGPFRYVLASPVFHRWHHVDDPALRDLNFAPTFPFLDVLFGTFYMPKGQLPQTYGAEGVPADFVGQLLHPFGSLAAWYAKAVRPGLGSSGA